MSISGQDFLNMYDLGERIQEQLIIDSTDPYESKQPRYYSVNEAAKLIGISHTYARKQLNLDEDPIPSHKIDGQIFLTLEQVNKMRSRVNINAGRLEHPGSDCQVLIVGNQKGGSAKSTTTLHLGQGLVQKGLSVLIVDADMQATLTESHAIKADQEIDDSSTLIGAFYEPDNDVFYDDGGFESWDIRKTIKTTSWDKLHLLPANQFLYEVDNAIALNIRNYGLRGEVYPYFKRVRDELDKLRPFYDVILIDSPPNLGLFATTLLYSADSMINTFQPTINDMLSTFRYWHLVGSILETTKKEYGFLRLLFTLDETDRVLPTAQKDENNPLKGKQSIEILRSIVRANFPDKCMQSTFKRSAAIGKTGALLNTVYEVHPSHYQGSRATLKKAIEMSNEVVNEVFVLLNEVWAEQSAESGSVRAG